MALITNPKQIVARWYRSAKAKNEGTNYGAKWIHWQPPVIRANDRRLITPVDENNKDLLEKRKFDLVRGKF